jgi:hypothetical protein
VGVPVGQRAGLAARLSRQAPGLRLRVVVFARPRRVAVPRVDIPRVDRASRRSYMFRAMFWPLAGGFIAFILVAILLGWILDPSRHGDADGHGPGH